MPAGNVGYTDTRSFSGSLLGDIASGIKDRIGDAALMARQERENAAKQLNVGGRDDGITQKEFDQEYGRGYFFKRALGSTFGGDRVARTRGYFEKNPPEKRDPRGTRESRFSAGFDYASKEGLIKSARPLQGPMAPEYLHSYDKRYADVLGDAAKFKDDSLDKDKVKAQTSMLSSGTRAASDTRSFGKNGDPKAVPVIDKELNEKVASALTGVELQMSRLEQKMEGGDGDDSAVAKLVSANSKLIVAGFTGIHSAMSSFLGAIEKQTQSMKTGARKQEIAENKAEAKENAAAEESGAEGLDGGAGNVGARFNPGGNKEDGDMFGTLFDILSRRGLSFGRGSRRLGAAGRLMRMKAGRLLRGGRAKLGGLKAGFGRTLGGLSRGIRGIGASTGASILLDLAFPEPTAQYDQVRGPNAYNRAPGYKGRPPKFNLGGSFAGGSPQFIEIGDTKPGVGESIIPESQKTFKDSASAQYQVMKKNAKTLTKIQAEGLSDFFNSPRGWEGMGKKLWESIKGIFGGGNGGPDGDMDPESRTRAGAGGNSSESQQEVAKVMYDELRKQGLSDEGAKLAIAEMGRENSLNRSTILGTHDDQGAKAWGAISWQGGREKVLLDELRARGIDPTEAGLRGSGDEGLKANAAAMIKEMGSRGNTALLDLLKTENLSDEQKDKVRQMMKSQYFVYNQSIPLQRSRDWYDSVIKMEGLGGGERRDAPEAPPSVAERISQLANPIRLPGIDTPSSSGAATDALNSLSTGNLFLKKPMQPAAGLTLPMMPGSNPYSAGSAQEPAPTFGIGWSELGGNPFAPVHPSGK